MRPPKKSEDHTIKTKMNLFWIQKSHFQLVSFLSTHPSREPRRAIRVRGFLFCLCFSARAKVSSFLFPADTRQGPEPIRAPGLFFCQMHCPRFNRHLFCLRQTAWRRTPFILGSALFFFFNHDWRRIYFIRQTPRHFSLCNTISSYLAHNKSHIYFASLSVSLVSLCGLVYLGWARTTSQVFSKNGIRKSNPFRPIPSYIRAGIRRKPVCKLPKTFRKRRKSGFLVRCQTVPVGNSDTSVYPSHINIQSAIFFRKFWTLEALP